MKTYLSILMAFIAFMPVVSQGPVIQDTQAEPYLNSLAKMFDPQKTLQIEFRYEVISKADSTSVSDYGSIIIKGPKYKLKLEDGEMYYNGDKLWVYNSQASEVYSSVPAGDENMDQMMLVPFRLLSKYKDYYKYRMKDDAILNGKAFAHNELYPKNLETSYSILRIFLDKKSRDLASLEMQQKNGVIYKIFVNEIITPVKVSDSAFSWDPASHPGVLEVEM